MPRRKKTVEPSKAQLKAIHFGRLIHEMTETLGWRELEQVIDERIASSIGRKTNGIWYRGCISGAKHDARREWYAGYADGLMTVLNDVQDFIRAKDRAERGIEEMKKPKVKYVTPMTDDEEVIGYGEEEES